MNIYYRPNINCLNTDQLHDLRETFAEIYKLPASHDCSFAKIAGLHGNPGNFCRHGSPGFLTWHRAYLEAIEDALRCVNCKVILPYWNWSSGSTTGVPAACREPSYVNRKGDTVANPLYAGPLPNGGMTSRRADINTTQFGDLATSAQNALNSNNFSSFQNAINSPHGGVHVRVGGNMASVALAGYDPIFYFHHANVDRLWATWQSSHTTSLPASESNFALEPFNKAFSSSWSTGSDYMTTDQLGFRYSTFCFFIPPWIFGPLKPVIIPPTLVKEPFNSARLQLKSSEMQQESMDIRVFLNDQNAGAITPTISNDNFAGSIGVFGMNNSEGDNDSMQKTRMNTATDQRFDLEIDITDSLNKFNDGKTDLSLSLVAVNLKGDLVKTEDIKFEEVQLLVE